MIRTTSFYDVICDNCGLTLSELEGALGAASSVEAREIAEQRHGFTTNRNGEALCTKCQEEGHTIRKMPRRPGHTHG